MNQYKANVETIASFLRELSLLLNSPNFNYKKNFIFAGKSERKKNTETMLQLNMDVIDVIEILKKLKISEYYQSVPDDKNSDMPDFHVFFTFVSEMEIYIKLRIQNIRNVLCISFHFPEYSHGKMPYNNE